MGMHDRAQGEFIGGEGVPALGAQDIHGAADDAFPGQAK